MKKKSIVAVPKEQKKQEDKPKLNYEELVMKNLSNPRLALDRSGYHFTELDLCVSRPIDHSLSRSFVLSLAGYF